MKSENFIMRIIARFLYLAILLHLSPVAAQLIPASDRVNWPGAGLWTDPPSCADTVFPRCESLIRNAIAPKTLFWKKPVSTIIAQTPGRFSRKDLVFHYCCAEFPASTPCLFFSQGQRPPYS